jgi:CoA:oxalate CoA-transferase
LKALEGIRVLDLTRFYSGPYCATLLADMGAEVIKVEPPGGEPMRDNPPWVENGKDGPHDRSRSGYFLGLNRNKYGMTLNLKHPKGLQIFKDMAKISDIVIENYTPGVMKKLGIDYKELKEVNPRIILVSISGFGQDGPYAKKMAFDIIAQAMSGLISLTGHPDSPPTKAGTSLGDVNAGVHGAFAAMAALWHREKSGKGQHIDLSMQEAMISILENAVVRWTIGGTIQGPIGSMNPNDAPMGAFLCKDGYIIICTVGNEHWHRFCRALGHDEWIDDPEYATKQLRWAKKYILQEQIEKVTAQYTVQELEALMERERVANSRIMNIKEVVEDPHLKERGYFLEVEHPIIGKAIVPGMPFKMSETPGSIERPSPFKR